MNETIIIILADRCRMELKLPIFLENSTLRNIKKVFQLMTVEPWRNEQTYETINCFFIDWENYLKKGVENSEIAQKAAACFVSTAKRQIACFGTMATPEMKKELADYEKRHKSATRAVKLAKSDLERCGKIINAYSQTIKNKENKEIENNVSK